MGSDGLVQGPHALDNGSFNPFLISYPTHKLVAMLRLLDLCSDFTVSLITDWAMMDEVAGKLCPELRRLIRVCGECELLQHTLARRNSNFDPFCVMALSQDSTLVQKPACVQ